MKKGALLISVVSDWINFLSILSSVHATDTCSSEESPQALGQHIRLFVRYTFLKLETKAQTSLWIKMRRLAKAFAASKLKYEHIQRPTPNFRPHDPPACAYIGDPCTYATSTVTHVRVNAILFSDVAMQYS